MVSDRGRSMLDAESARHPTGGARRGSRGVRSRARGVPPARRRIVHTVAPETHWSDRATHLTDDQHRSLRGRLARLPARRAVALKTTAPGGRLCGMPRHHEPPILMVLILASALAASTAVVRAQIGTKNGEWPTYA